MASTVPSDFMDGEIIGQKKRIDIWLPVTPINATPLRKTIESSGRQIPDRFAVPEGSRPQNSFPKLGLPSAGSTMDIPLVDLSGTGTGGFHARQVAAAQVVAAAERFNVFHVQVPTSSRLTSIAPEMQKLAREFLHLPLDERMKYFIGRDEGELKKEGYGHHDVIDGASLWREFLHFNTRPVEERDEKVWPTIPAGFRETVHEYSLAVYELTRQILGLLAEGIGLDQSAFANAIGKDLQIISTNYYPPCPQPELTLGINAHTDSGVITILYEDDVPGLQVFKDNEWFTITPRPGVFTVVTADLLEVLSNGKYKSTRHRAVVNSIKPRMTIVSGYRAGPDVNVSPIADLIDAEHPPLFREMNVGEFNSPQNISATNGEEISALKPYRLPAVSTVAELFPTEVDLADKDIMSRVDSHRFTVPEALTLVSVT